MKWECNYLCYHYVIICYHKVIFVTIVPLYFHYVNSVTIVLSLLPCYLCYQPLLPLLPLLSLCYLCYQCVIFITIMLSFLPLSYLFYEPLLPLLPFLLLNVMILEHSCREIVRGHMTVAIDILLKKQFLISIYTTKETKREHHIGCW